MKQLLKVSLFVLMFTQLALGSAAADTWKPFGGAGCNNGGDSSAVCQGGAPQGDPISGKNGLIIDIANIVAVAAGIAAVIIIVLAGLRYIQSGGKSEDITAARRMIIYSLVGLVVIVLARTIIAFVLGLL